MRQILHRWLKLLSKYDGVCKVELLCEAVNKFGILGTCLPAELVIQVNDVQRQIRSITKQTQQRHAVRSPTDADSPCTCRHGGDGIGW